jgi:para-nitrobenzyl esterase
MEESKMKKRRIINIAVITILVAGFLINAVPGYAHRWNKWCEEFPTTVTTKYGRIEGLYNSEDTVAWTGVPFAKPPVGDLRWKAPQNPDPWWGEVLDTTQACVPCTQLETADNWIRKPWALEGSSEDCLYLSIYRPKTCEKYLPVYVYIHGGSNNFGTANDYDGSVIARESNMVVVVVQYRLGPLGWLTHPSLRHGGSALDDSGNFGTLDNIKALEWIQRNIEAFGGNPENVTITGESAGAHNVMNLVISPLAKGLFHRAMSQSGGMTTDTVAEGEAQADDNIKALLAADGLEAVPGGDVEDYLRSKSAAEIFEAYFKSYQTLPTYDAYQDGVILPGSVVSTIQSGHYNKVPIILGANEFETKSFLPLYRVPVPSSDGKTWFDLIEVLESVDDPDGLKLDEVLPTPADKLYYQTFAYNGSRSWRATFVDERARALREQQKQVYAYLFKWGGNSNIGSGPWPFDFIYGPGHAMEISFFFGGDTSLWGYGYSPENDTAGRQALSEAMMAYLSNFARTGNPNHADWGRWHKEDDSGLPEWQTWNNGGGKPKIMEFDANFNSTVLNMSNEEVLLP